MVWLHHAADWIGRVLLGVVAASVAASMLLGTGDVVGTQVFNQPVPGATEAISNLLVVIVYGALPYVQRRRGHIRMELLYANVGPRAKAAMDLVTSAVALAFFSFLLWQAIAEASWSWSHRQTEMGLIRFPVYPFKAALAVGVACLLLQLVADMIADLQRLRRPGPS
jgi:TRAP-type C4-dicarboxylate transport system permease small subunit